MKKEYDFSKAERGKFHRPKKIQRTLRIDADILQFFETMAEDAGIPYQTLINLTLRKFANEDGEIILKATGSPKKSKRA